MSDDQEDFRGSGATEVRSPFADQMPALFDSRGVFAMPSDEAVAALDGSKAERLLAVRDAAEALAEAETNLITAKEAVTLCATALKAAKERLPKPQTFMDLWKTMKRTPLY